MTMTMATASAGNPASTASPLATHNMIAKKWRSWSASRRPGDRSFGAGNSLGPSLASRARACADVSPAEPVASTLSTNSIIRHEVVAR